MKTCRVLFIFVSVILICAAAQKRPVHIFMAGDSTMANKTLFRTVEDSLSGDKITDVWPERGWGMLLPDFFSSNVVIDNYAKNGRSTRTFISEGLWDKLINKVHPGDYVVLQFGHNDQSVEKKDRYTPPADFEKNFQFFIDEVKAKKGIPILCTPVVRRKFEKGTLVDTHGEYPDIIRNLAKKNKVLLVDMYDKTKDLLIDLGDQKSKQLFMHIPKGYTDVLPNGLVDNTHYVEKGARITAQFFVDALKELKIQPLVNELKENIQPFVSKVWSADLGSGKYKNPVLYADYSDPDVCRAGDDYYMTASSFNCIPGLPILHSKDLVNWTLINHALPKSYVSSLSSRPNHGGEVWAPAIRYHNNVFYIYWGDPDKGIFMTKTKNPAGEWETPTLVKEGLGLIDSCPFWDEDGQAYLVHAYAGSRAGIKSMLAISKLTHDGKKAIGTSQIVYDGHALDPTIEGPKLYKKDDYYYIFAPAGGVATGWQTVLRAENIWGPYERKVVLAQGKSNVNGPHQGAWVDTKKGEDWFLHFQDQGAYGRVVHLQPMKWVNAWPVIGVDKDGDGCGEPVAVYQKPNVGEKYPEATPVDSDEFDGKKLGLQWQWHATPDDWWSFLDAQNGLLRLYSVPQSSDYKNLWNVPNLLLQKFPGQTFTATTKITFNPNSERIGERTGLVIMGLDYALLAFENTKEGLILTQKECLNAEKGTEETTNESVFVGDKTIYLRVQVKENAQCFFSYSLDGKKYKTLGKAFSAKEGKWIGAKIGLFCSRPDLNNDGGYAEVDWFRFEK